jgi:nitrogen fixation NifU-like protein
MDHYKNPRNKGVLDNGSMTVDMNNPTCAASVIIDALDIEIEQPSPSNFAS